LGRPLRRHLAATSAGLTYANVAIRSKLVAQVIDEQEPLPQRSAPDWGTTRLSDLTWAGSYAAPWLSRRLRGVSSGDGIEPKRPNLLPR
jgi:hypothetical protein